MESSVSSRKGAICNRHANSARITHLASGITKSAQTRSRDNSYRLAMDAMLNELKDRAEGERAASANGLRRHQVGSGERSDKRRTYRFQEDRVMDHVSGKTVSCAKVMAGRFDLLT